MLFHEVVDFRHQTRVRGLRYMVGYRLPEQLLQSGCEIHSYISLRVRSTGKKRDQEKALL
jgi:hypothetical protein